MLFFFFFYILHFSPDFNKQVMSMRRFSTLMSITRRAQVVSRHFSDGCPSQHHHMGGGSPFLMPSSNCPPFPHLLSRHFVHTNSRLEQPKQTTTPEIVITSTEYIKPASATPSHLRTFKLSILDQLVYPLYSPCVLFFHNTSVTHNPIISNVTRNLKTSLSELLTRFYPFAGRIKDDFEIDCNDQGVYVAEARVNCNLLDFLCQPDDEGIRRLLPQEDPSTKNSMLTSYVVSVQVNIFNCGGIALTTCLSHKIFDGTTYIMFLKAWAGIMRGSSEVIIHPSFIASSLFPQSRCLKNSFPTKLLHSTKTTITRRFVFSATSLASLKAKALPSSSVQGPTRVEAASSLIWKCAAKAASQVRSFSRQSPHILFTVVNIRKRHSPQLPPEAIGNLIMGTIAVSFPKAELELVSLMGEVKKSIASINNDLFSMFKGKEGYLQADKLLKLYTDLVEPLDDGDCLICTSLCKSGLYEIDFGWGKPVWFSYINPGAAAFVTLVDTLKGDGIEATVSLSPEEMAIFELDQELLSYTSKNQSPLMLAGINSQASRP